MTAATWLTLDTARQFWPDAPADDDLLSDLLELAKDAVLAFAPPQTDEASWDPDPVNPGYLIVNDPGDIPARYRQAQLLQAKNTWNAARANPSGDLGDGTFALTTRPLDWQVRQLIRPKRGIPFVG